VRTRATSTSSTFLPEDEPVPTEATASAWDRLRSVLRGTLVVPTDDTYSTARRVWNGRIDRRPAAVARRADAADVRACVRFARERDLRLAVRGGGHAVAGLAVCDGGLVVDLSRMKGVRVDPRARVATVEPGATLGDLDHATQVFGLATPTRRTSAAAITTSRRRRRARSDPHPRRGGRRRR